MHTETMIKNMTSDEKIHFGYPVTKEEIQEYVDSQLEELSNEKEELETKIHTLETELEDYKDKLEQINLLSCIGN